jgi:folate-binding protein YgfZ
VADVELAEAYRVLRMTAGGFAWPRDVVIVRGPEAATYLQGQCSQDVAGLAYGATAWALVLQPQGRLDAFVRVTRRNAEEFVLDVDAGAAQTLVDRLSRFKLRTKVEFAVEPWMVLAVRGPDAGISRPFPDDGLVVADFEWGGISGYDLIGPEPSLPSSVIPVPAAAWEVLRIEAGFPVAPAELDERTIPAEAGLVASSVSFTKGCYTGQELVARIDSRGSNVPRRLRRLRFSGPVAVGASLIALGKEVGRVTSVTRSPELGWVGLGYVQRAVEPPAVAVAINTDGAATGEGEVETHIEALPA